MYVVPAEAAPYVASGALDENLFNVTLLAETGTTTARPTSCRLLIEASAGRAARRRRPPRAPARSGRSTASTPVAATAHKADIRTAWESIRGPTRRTAGQHRRPARRRPARSGSTEGPGHARRRRGPDRRARRRGRAATTATAPRSPCSTPATTRATPTSPAGSRRRATSAERPVRDGRRRQRPRHPRRRDGRRLGRGVGRRPQGRRTRRRPADRQGARRQRRGPHRPDHRRHGVGRRPGRRRRQHEPRHAPRPSDGTDLMSQAVNELTESSGTLFVVAAGNTGPASGAVGAPGAADLALTVGAVDKDDEPAAFSSRGPRDRRRRDQARDHRPGRRHRGRAGRRHLARQPARRALHLAQRHLDGDAARRRCCRNPRPTTPGLDSRSAQGAAGVDRQDPAEPAGHVPGRRPGRRRRRDPRLGERGPRHALSRAPRQRRRSGHR